MGATEVDTLCNGSRRSILGLRYSYNMDSAKTVILRLKNIARSLSADAARRKEAGQSEIIVSMLAEAAKQFDERSASLEKSL